MKPSIGRIVHYTLSDVDVLRIKVMPHDNTRNGHLIGQHLPMIICVVHEACVTGQVFLDGQDSLWIVNRVEGTEPGTWHWPERVEE